jgi:hypothetical protein
MRETERMLAESNNFFSRGAEMEERLIEDTLGKEEGARDKLNVRSQQSWQATFFLSQSSLLNLIRGQLFFCLRSTTLCKKVKSVRRFASVIPGFAKHPSELER